MAATDLCTINQVNAWIYNPVTIGTVGNTAQQQALQTQTQALLASLITNCTALITTYVGYQIYPVSTFNLTLDGTGNASIRIPLQPIFSITSVTIGQTIIPACPVPGGAGYSFDSAASVVNLTGYCFPRGFQTVNIQGTAGYAAIPADINQACIELVAYKFIQKDHTGIKSLTKNGANVNETTSYMPPEVLAVINRYKRTTFY